MKSIKLFSHVKSNNHYCELIVVDNENSNDIDRVTYEVHCKYNDYNYHCTGEVNLEYMIELFNQQSRIISELYHANKVLA